MSTSPDLSDADYLNGQGIAFDARGQIAEALACYQQALTINPNHADAHNNLGTVIFGQGQWTEAGTCFRQALRINPHHGGALNNLGYVLFKQGQVAEAQACYRQALLLNPHHADAHNNLGLAHAKLGQVAEAQACYQEALRINPNHADAHNNLGLALTDLGQTAEALACFRQSLRINPNQVDSLNNLGNVLKDLGQLDEACACFHQVLRLNPNHADAHNNLGNAFFVAGRFAEASACYEQARALDSGNSQAHYNHALVRLLQGDFQGGWPGYEQRWAQPGRFPRSFQQPTWDGTPLLGKTILLHAEQGLGDTIQFIRYASLVKKCAGRVLVECQPALLGVLEGTAGIDQLVARGEPLPAFNVQVKLLSLPSLFGTTLATIPAAIPYLTVGPKLVERWRKLFSSETTGTTDLGISLNIGIVWQGSPGHRGDYYRSVTLGHFAPLANIKGVRLVSLQVGPGSEQMVGAPFPIIDLGGKFNPSTLEDLLAAVMNLDLIITVDTAVAHLAGALGKPVWVLLPFAPDWRWLLERQDSPWYPTMRLFRQRQLGDWSDVVERIASELQGAAGSSNRG